MKTGLNVDLLRQIADELDARPTEMSEIIHERAIGDEDFKVVGSARMDTPFTIAAIASHKGGDGEIPPGHIVVETKRQAQGVLGLSDQEAEMLFAERWPLKWYAAAGVNLALPGPDVTAVAPTHEIAAVILREMARQGRVSLEYDMPSIDDLLDEDLEGLTVIQSGGTGAVHAVRGTQERAFSFGLKRALATEAEAVAAAEQWIAQRSDDDDSIP